MDVGVCRRSIQRGWTSGLEAKWHIADRRRIVRLRRDGKDPQILAEVEGVVLTRVYVGKIGVRSGRQVEDRVGLRKRGYE